jgi:hypothetical protein
MVDVLEYCQTDGMPTHSDAVVLRLQVWDHKCGVHSFVCVCVKVTYLLLAEIKELGCVDTSSKQQKERE